MDALVEIHRSGDTYEIEVDLGEDRSICQGDSVVIDAGFVEGATYTWTPLRTSQELVMHQVIIPLRFQIQLDVQKKIP